MEFLAWAVGILIILIIIRLYFWPETGLFAKIRDPLFQYGSDQFPTEKPLEVTKQRVPEDVEKYFDNLVSKIKNPGTLNSCLVDIGQAPNMKDFNIVLYDNRLQIEKKSGQGLAPFEKKAIVEGFKPCSIKGSKSPLFYDCFMKSGPCENAYEAGNAIINKDVSFAPFLYKFDNSHMCFIFLDGRDIYPGCTKLDDSVDDACVHVIKEKVLSCMASARVEDTKECTSGGGKCISASECSVGSGSAVSLPCPADMVCCTFGY